MTASRISHSTPSKGWEPSFEKNRFSLNPLGFAERSCSMVATDGPFLIRGEGLRLSNYNEGILPLATTDVKASDTTCRYPSIVSPQDVVVGLDSPRSVPP